LKIAMCQQIWNDGVCTRVFCSPFQVSDNCFAVLNEKNRVCDANSGLINRAGGVVIDTQSDLAHARQMIEMLSKVWPAMPRRVINTRAWG
jgi:cyclase